MTENKLTDEEIVKAFELCVMEEHKGCVHCGEFVSQFDCMRNAISNALDLIRRLQDENKRLTEEVNLAFDIKETISGIGKKSSELLTENEKILKENAELQKQVDELIFERDCAEAENERWINLVEQAVKDTAKEILDDVLDCIESMLDGERYMTKNEVEYLLEHILNKKQEYGVEVE